MSTSSKGTALITGPRIQAVLPGTTATELWDKAGLPSRTCPQQSSCLSALPWRRPDTGLVHPASTDRTRRA